MNDIKISQKMKSKGLFSIEKDNIKYAKIKWLHRCFFCLATVAKIFSG